MRSVSLSVSKSWYWIGKNRYKYHNIEEIRELPNSRLPPGEDKIARLFIRLSDTIELKNVTLIGILDLASIFGGLMGSVLKLRVFIIFFAEDVIIANILDKMFTFRAYETGVRISEQSSYVKSQIEEEMKGYARLKDKITEGKNLDDEDLKNIVKRTSSV